MLKGGGIGQPSDPPGGSSYFDPILQHNGQAEARQGLLQRHLRRRRHRLHRASRATGPFFAYLAFNCPHDPAPGARARAGRVQGMNLSLNEFPQLGQPIPAGVRGARRDRSRGSMPWSPTSTPTSARS